MRSKVLETTMKRQAGGSTTTLPITSVNAQMEITAAISIGGETITLRLDTGSTLLWVVKRGFQCYSDYQFAQPTDASHCAFTGGYQQDSSFVPNNTDADFSIEYGGAVTDAAVGGIYGTVPVSIGDVTLQQSIGLADKVTYGGSSNTTSGLLGLGPGTVYDSNTYIPYYDLFSRMQQQGTPPLFSIGFAEDGNTGSLVLGGTRTSSSNAPWASTLMTQDGWTYTIRPDALVYGPPSKSSKKVRRHHHPTSPASTVPIPTAGPNNSTLTAPSGSQHSIGYPLVIDTGTPNIVLPRPDAQAVNNLFSGGAQPDGDYFTVACDAKPPSFGLVLGGETVYVRPQDMIWPESNVAPGKCHTAISVGPDGSPGILGLSFLRGLNTVFDRGAQEMRFQNI